MGEGLRERKKRETRLRISDIATGMFVARGFDNVTVAEVARAADVSVNTVFNYFATKEDLLLDRAPEVEELLARVFRERRPGESVLEAVRRDLLDALDTGHYRYGFHEADDAFVRMVESSPSLSARVREMNEARERKLAEAIAGELGTGPGDLTPPWSRRRSAPRSARSWAMPYGACSPARASGPSRRTCGGRPSTPSGCWRRGSAATASDRRHRRARGPRERREGSRTREEREARRESGLSPETPITPCRS
nr:hypothetical protein GCM10020093_005630 [Planobispora longispora]